MASSQGVKGLVLHPVRPVRRFIVMATAVLVALALALAIALAQTPARPGATSGGAVYRAANDALVQFRKDEREERFAPSVEEIRRALIQFRASEREERLEP